MGGMGESGIVLGLVVWVSVVYESKSLVVKFVMWEVIVVMLKFFMRLLVE